jgi:hypothetical protein
MLDFSKVHPILEAATGVKIFAAGQNVETAPLPYITYEFSLPEKKYREYQVLKGTLISSGDVGTVYANPTSTTVQYTLSYDSKQIKDARDKIRAFYMYLCTQEFKLALNRLTDTTTTLPLNITFTITKDITQSMILKSDFFEHQFFFEVRYNWMDSLKVISSDVIESADDPVEVSPPTGA